jgi:hypothetical protein
MPTLAPSQLNPVNVNTNFTDSVNVVFTGPEEEPRAVLSVVKNFTDDFITTSFTDTSVTVAGKYSSSTFNESFLKHITRGSTDKVEQPQTATRFEDVDPISRQVFNFSPDKRNVIEASYTVITTEGNVELTQTVFNNYSPGRDSLRGYI